MEKVSSHVSSGKVVCPACGDFAFRTRRNLFDRLLSLVKPVRRYRCDFCNWTGKVPVSASVEHGFQASRQEAGRPAESSHWEDTQPSK
ncbi:MAG: hypothetical protein M3R45_06920 [Pseudomonadota bacterium]|nr:hypothetical protein [Pseudomonadota bacterium]